MTLVDHPTIRLLLLDNGRRPDLTLFGQVRHLGALFDRRLWPVRAEQKDKHRRRQHQEKANDDPGHGRKLFEKLYHGKPPEVVERTEVRLYHNFE